MDIHDVVVLGVGGLGAAACYWATRRGLDVVGFEQFPLAHQRGGSQDHSRIIPRATNRHDDAQLIDAAYAHWRDVEADAGQQLLTLTGGLVVEDSADPGPDPPAQSIDAYAQVMAAHGFPFERLDAGEIAARWGPTSTTASPSTAPAPPSSANTSAGPPSPPTAGPSPPTRRAGGATAPSCYAACPASSAPSSRPGRVCTP